MITNNHNEGSNLEASMKSVKMSDKKIRVLAKMLVGKKIVDLIPILSVQKVKSAKFFYKLVNSLAANASTKNIDVNTLSIKSISVDRGPFSKRLFTRSQGRANYIKKRSSHITIRTNKI